MSQIETQWPEGYGPPPDGWEWVLVPVACAHCGVTNELHEQPPAWLENPSGVLWECNACSGVNKLGGLDPSEPFDVVQECGACHSTFAGGEGSALETDDVAADGSWTCPVCGAENRLVTASERAAGATEGGVG